MTLGPRPEAAAPVYAALRRRVAPTLRDRALHLVLPASCLGCHAPLTRQVDRAALGLCSACRGRLRPAPLLESPPGIDRLLALWAYGPPLDRVIHRLKFGRLDYLGRQLGEVLADSIRGEVTEGRQVDMVVPIPLHWWRQLFRGFNQAEEIARSLAARLGLPCLPALGRRRATPAQSSLTRTERLRNLPGAFRVRSRLLLRVRGSRVLLLDDVTTTGATLAAAAAALLEAGAESVQATVVAQTPRGV